MPLPRPYPGLVIRYEFLWSHERAAGATEGVKLRPCVVVLAVRERSDVVAVTVAPITHRPPDEDRFAIEIPRNVKDHLGLDAARSWIVATDLNEFAWPGEHIFPIPGGRPDQYDCGTIPPRLLDQLIAKIDALAVEERARIDRSAD